MGLVARYLVLGALWVGVARGLVPRLIAAAYRGESLGFLNRVFRRRTPHPLEHYLALWNHVAGAVLLALVLHWTLVVIVRHFERGARTASGRFVLVAGALFLALAVISGPRHDYVADLEIWHEVSAGRDPWWILPDRQGPLNAYGPLFNLLAWPARWNPLAPKLTFAYAYLVFQAWLVRLYGPRRWGVDLPSAVFLAGLGTPLAWIEVAYYGHFDVLVGLACVVAVEARLRDRDAAAGLSLGLGILLKYVPVVVVPFLAVDGLRVRVRLLAVSVLATALGIWASIMVWGPSTFRPLSFAAQRGSNLLSIFRFLRGAYSPLRLVWDDPNLDKLAAPSLAVAGLAVFAWCVLRRVEPRLSAVLAVLVTLLLYQVGFTQYQLILFMLVSLWIVGTGPAEWGGRWVPAALGAYFGWLNLYEVAGCALGMQVMIAGGPWGWVEEVVGLPTFVLGAFLLACLLRTSARGAGFRLDSHRGAGR